MDINDLKTKIPEVMAYARVAVREHGHTRKFAKHIAALIMRQLLQIQTDIKLIEFISTNPLGKEIGYDHRPDPSIFSKVRDRIEPEALSEIITDITTTEYRNTVIDNVIQDSTDIDAYSKNDKDARWGKRTIPKKRQTKESKKVEDFFGYKLHMDVDGDREIPLSMEIISGNRNDKIMFMPLFVGTKRNFRLRRNAKFIADAQYSSHKINGELRYNGLIPVIPISGNRYMKTVEPKDPDYAKRWSIERVFSRLKETFNMVKNRFIGLKKVKIFVYSCILAYLVEYLL